ncbi:translation initiation factor SU [Pyrenochaeta sp. DS3sAY3a]|nr:translation initiation factor SU [Pyrenochaeta sp. DS3sAY3a]
MASKKDMRRADLIVPYAEPKDKNENDMSSTMASTLPMAAMFTRNKMIGWVAVVFAIQSWLAETPEQRRTSTTPAYFSVGMSLMSLLVVRLASSSPSAVGCLIIRHRVTPRCCSHPHRAVQARLRAQRHLLQHLCRRWKSTTCRRGATKPRPPPMNVAAVLPICKIQYSSDPVTQTTSTQLSIATLCSFAPSQQQPHLQRVPTSSHPFAEADEDTGQAKQSQQDYIHIRIQQRNGRKTLTTVQGLPKKFDQKKILKVIKKKFACNGTIVADTEMGEVIQLQGDQRKDVQDFMTDKKEGLGLDAKTIKVHGF